MNKLVTIGLPFFNSENTLEFAINSVLMQTHKNIELIIINDGSNDNSDKIVRKFLKHDPRIKYFQFKDNMGLVFRLNQIVELSNSDYIARMDSDDIMLNTRIEKQLNILLDDTTIDVVATGIYTIDELNNPIGIRDIKPIETSIKKILEKKFITHPTILARRIWFLKNKYLNYQRAEDLELWLRTCNSTKFYRIEEPLYIYREGNVNVSNYLKTNKTFLKLLNEHKNINVKNSYILKLKFLTYLKSFLFSFFGYFNLQYLLVKKRNHLLNNEEKKLVNEIISSVKNYKQSYEKV
jgi:glycosyltransferase involved in cell wall biosynthesis